MIDSDCQGISEAKLGCEEFLAKLLDRRWTLLSPDTKIQQIMLSAERIKDEDGPLKDKSWFNMPNPLLGDEIADKSGPDSSFYVIRDDLLHPLINGNKARKLDAVLPLLEDHSVTDVVRPHLCKLRFMFLFFRYCVAGSILGIIPSLILFLEHKIVKCVA